MNDKKDEALKLALEALEKVTTEMLALKDELAERGARPTTNVFHQRLWDSAFKAYTDHALPAAAAIREALAEQPAQQLEPVGEVSGYYERGFTEQKTLYGKLHNQDLPVGAKLYTAPQPSKSLTGDEVRQILDKCDDGQESAELILAFARAIEAKLREKNA